MLATTCFTRDQLERYLHGRTDDDLSGAIEGHLESCPRCEDTLSDLDTGDDTLVRTLQVKRGIDSEQAPAWVARMASLPYDDLTPTALVDEAVSTTSPAELGDYELVKVLGRGGMSVVFAARHKHLGREVALKVLLPTAQQHAVSRERFTREMRAVGGLDHAAIIRATDAGESHDTLYLVMEQIDGVDLNRISKTEGPLRISDACAIGIEVARGLAYAHQQGVVHRDIKPSNLMLDRSGHVKILDFGLARMQSPACDVSLQTTMGQLLGTLDYMAPEQASGCDVDARADIYALGATLFKLLTGTPPHGRSAEMPIIEFLHRLATSDAKRLDAIRDTLPEELVELVGSMLQRDPSQRIVSAEEVARRLEPFASGAQLSELATCAAEKSARSSHDDAPQLMTDWTHFCTKPLAEVESSPKTSSSPPAADQKRNGVGGWLALATGVISLIGVVALTIILTLKSPEGELRIESELDNIKVEVVDEKDRVDVISVDQGLAITTVRAGRYRIRLDASTDGIEITPREVIVTKDKVAIARIQKISETSAAVGDATPEQARFAARETQLQLTVTMDELAEAKRQPQPDKDAIKALEEKLARLRASTRPIPTEPVYQGRTLGDWVAQMRYEQESTARKSAATNVLRLADTRPDAERMELALEAGSRLYGWNTRTLENTLHDLLKMNLYDLGSYARRVKEIDQNIAAACLVQALQGDDLNQREYALTLCADLRDEIRLGQWPGILSALKTSSKAERGEATFASAVLYAACLPDDTAAAEALAAIDIGEASATEILTVIYAAHDRKLPIARGKQLDWLAKYFDSLSLTVDPSRYPEPMVSLWSVPTLGPFRHVDWNHVDVALQKDINTVVGPLLATFDQRLASVDQQPSDEARQFDAAIKCRMVTNLIQQVHLTEATQQLAVGLLERRLAQLLQIRATRRSEFREMSDSPASVAGAILLLTGRVPAAIKQPQMNETGILAERLAEARKVLTAAQGAASFRNTQAMRVHYRHLTLADWYPYELLALFVDAINREIVTARNNSSTGRGGFSRGTTSMRQLMQTSPSWTFDARLMLDYAATSETAAEIINEGLDASEITPSLIRHPNFARTVDQWMEIAENQAVAALVGRLWISARSQEQVNAQLLSWLKSGNTIHARFAMDVLDGTNKQLLLGDWAEHLAGAIDRIAMEDQLNLRELDYLDALKEKAPNAAAHAAKYLMQWLENADARAGQGGGRRSASGSLMACFKILNRSPEQAEKLRQPIQEILDKPPSELGSEDRRILEFLFRQLSG